MALLILAAVLIPSDGRISEVVRTADLPGELDRVLNRAETFGHGAGVIMIALTLLVCLRPNFKPGLCAAAAALGAGMTANVVKLMVARTRPSDLAEAGGGTFPQAAILKYGSVTDYLAHVVTKSQQSFPSAHTATAFGLAAALTGLFPSGRLWFALLAVLVGLQRIVNGAHYVSDVLIGAAIGIVVGRVIVARFLAAQATPDTMSSGATIPHPSAGQSASHARAA